MNFLLILYTEVLYRPLFNGLVWFYNILPKHDLGLAIIALTFVIRLILSPILWQSQRAQKDLAKLQPEIKRIQQGFKGNKEAQGKALMELYGKNKVNPFSGCVMALIQLPILIALFRVFQQGFNPSELSNLYTFIKNPGMLNPISFGIVNLSHGNVYLGVVAAITQYFQIKMTMPSSVPAGDKNDMSRMIQLQSLYLFPVLIFVWSFKLPAALTIYWTVLNLFGILQEIIMRRLVKSQ